MAPQKNMKEAKICGQFNDYFTLPGARDVNTFYINKA
jgi:hypothetical protein